MKHLGTKKLETERLILRRFIMDDAQGMFNNWASDEGVTKYLSWPPHKDVALTKAYLEMVIKEYEEPTMYNWAIELKEIGEVIGSIGVVQHEKEVESVHIGYTLGKAWWNKGIMTEAFTEVIKFLMSEVEVNRIDARHDTKNPNSGRVMKKCGLKYEGTLRQASRNNQGICDVAWYSLLREDYPRDKQDRLLEG